MYVLIQVLRGLAALIVVLHHALTPADGIPVDQTYFHFGAAGVDIFFVISGFIIYTSTTSRSQSPGDFLLRRAARIFPPYWAATLLLIATHLALGMQRDMVLSTSHVIQSFLLIAHDSPTEPGHPYPLLIPGWTLQYEIFFYVLFALALFFRQAAALGFITATLVGLVLLGAVVGAPVDQVAFNVYTNPLLLEFLAGIFIGVLANRQPSIFGAGFALLIPAGFLLLAMSDHADLPRMVEWGIPAIIIVFGAVAGEKLKNRWRIPQLLVTLGNASYSIYLTHIITLGLVRGVLRKVFVDGVWWIPLFIVACVVASCLAGVLFYHLVEKPLVKGFTRIVSRPARSRT